MTRLPQPVTFAVTFKTPGGVSDASAVRQLRRCLKHAGGVCQFRCTRAVRVAGGESQLEGGQPLVDLPLVPSSEVQTDA